MHRTHPARTVHSVAVGMWERLINSDASDSLTLLLVFVQIAIFFFSGEINHLGCLKSTRNRSHLQLITSQVHFPSPLDIVL